MKRVAWVGIWAGLAAGGCRSSREPSVDPATRAVEVQAGGARAAPKAASSGLPGAVDRSGKLADGGAAAPSNGRGPRGVWLVDAPPAGEVTEIVREAAATAAAGRRTLVVYVGARWCEPCRRFHHAAASGELDSHLPALALLVFDADRDRDRLEAAGYGSSYIPLFALPSPDGTASAHRLEGAIKGEGAVDFIVPRLQALLAAGR